MLEKLLGGAAIAPRYSRSGRHSMSDMHDVSISVAKLEVQVQTLEKDVSEIKSDIKFIRQKLDQAAGGWRVFLMVGTAGAALGGLIFKLIDFLTGK